MTTKTELLDGCVCQYVPEHLREQVESLAEKTGTSEVQVVNMALQIGLAVIIGKTPELLASTLPTKHGTMKGKLSGNGV